jgi:hypothetical protein
MFKPTSRQRTLFETEQRLSDSVRRRLKGTWAEGFQSKVLPLLLDAEMEFAALYSDETGRPNWSAARMLGICVLQEMLGLDDQSALDSLAFDVRWQHALGLEPEEAYLSRRSLVEFRSRLVAEDPEMKALRRLFERVGDAAVEELGLSTKEQRVDSTLVTSNIFTRGRVELFRKTLVHFMDWLFKEHPDRLERLSRFTRQWYDETKGQGWFGKVDKDKAKQQAGMLAERLYEVVRTFAEDDEIKDGEPYLLVARLFAEHCVVESAAGPKDGDEGDGCGEKEEPTPKLVLRDKLEAPSGSLQSPYDPDAGYGYKGPGYLVHVAETCNNEKTEIITDYGVVPAGETDRGKDADIIERLCEAGRQPEVLYEDGGYPTGQGIIDAAHKGTEIVAPMTGGRLPANTIGRERFEFDATTGHCTRCPAGHAPIRHDLRTTYQNNPPTLHAYFDGDTCRACALQSRCVVRAPNNGKKGSFHLEVGAHLVVRDQALAAQRDAAWWDRYKIRSGIEATMSELKRGHGLGKLRVRRAPRVLIAVGLKVTACNVKRWLRAVSMSDWGAAELAQESMCVANEACQALWSFLTRMCRRSWPIRSLIAA